MLLCSQLAFNSPSLKVAYSTLIEKTPVVGTLTNECYPLQGHAVLPTTARRSSHPRPLVPIHGKSRWDVRASGLTPVPSKLRMRFAYTAYSNASCLFSPFRDVQLTCSLQTTLCNVFNASTHYTVYVQVRCSFTRPFLRCPAHALFRMRLYFHLTSPSNPSYATIWQRVQHMGTSLPCGAPSRNMPVTYCLLPSPVRRYKTVRICFLLVALFI